MERASQILINNGFSNKDVERTTKKILDNWYNAEPSRRPEATDNIITIYYKSTFSTAYKEDEMIMQQIIKRNVKPTDPNTQIKLVIYYQNKKTSHLLLRNNIRQAANELQKSHVIYRYTCKLGDCATQPSTYIGMTTMKLSRRLSYHLSTGAPKNHHRDAHHATLKRETLVENTEILAVNQDQRRLPILEALFIKELSPNLNIQGEDLQALPSLKRLPENIPSGVTT